MQSWCLEAFELESESDLVTGADQSSEFIGDESAASGTTPNEGAVQFRRELGFSDPDTILSHMSQKERSVVFELVELDVAAAYEQREQELRDELQVQQDKALSELRESSRDWARKFTENRDRELGEMSDACARLAVELAEKIVRSRVEGDPTVIARAVETALRFGEGGSQLTVTVAPEDAAWLEGEEELRERLGIARVVADRRISRGGCVVDDGQREWNATLEGQLSTLAEVIDEWIATADGRPADQSVESAQPDEPVQREQDDQDEDGKESVETPVE